MNPHGFSWFTNVLWHLQGWSQGHPQHRNLASINPQNRCAHMPGTPKHTTCGFQE
uniref:Uncharacterized protein n=1 Tax=Anguilla anguilla TaxID=7936 RepID=A0A0E9R8F0_ANGAN